MCAEAEVLMIWLPRIFEQLRAAECITSFACVESLAVSNRPASGKSTGGCWMLDRLDFRFGSKAVLTVDKSGVRYTPRKQTYRPALTGRVSQPGSGTGDDIISIQTTATPLHPKGCVAYVAVRWSGYILLRSATCRVATLMEHAQNFGPPIFIHFMKVEICFE